MKALPTLIKVAQRKIDDTGREIAQAQMAVDGLKTARALASGRAATEMGEAQADIRFLNAIPAYLNRHKAECARLDQDIEQAEQLIAQIRERLMAAYQEKRRLESLETLYADRARVEAATREQAALDEAALNRR